MSASLPAINAFRQRGVAIILMMTVLVLAATTYIVTSSPNALRTERIANNADVLDQTRQALTGYALIQAIPGSLPCPDTTGDGQANVSGTSCSSQLGLVPYRTLGIPELSDATGALLWYAVALEYLANAVTTKNSSLQGSLTLDGQRAAAIIIAPGAALDNQSRRTLVIADFLEGVNADANLADYTTVISETQNDQLLAIEPDTLWALTEVRVTEATADLLNSYRTTCGEYPWAANFGGPYTSVASQQTGAVPFTTALPWDWNTVCPFGTAPSPPAWLVNHWSSELAYSMCTVADGNCVTMLNAADSPAAGAIVAPGPRLTGQIRPSTVISEFFEDENSNASSVDFKFENTINHSASFNDSARLLVP